MKLVSIALAATCAIILLSATRVSLYAQAAVSWGELSGQLRDQAGGAVPGASVTVDGPISSAETVTSDEQGTFRFERVTPGTYAVAVDAPGFAPYTTDIVIRPGMSSELTVQLTAVVAIAGLTVESAARPGSTIRAPEISERALVLAGTANTIVQLDGLPANTAERTVRQIFARVPGAFAYDMDGSGNQVSVSTRGLDPHRSWEFNVRQDGILTNTDLYAYPASHYGPPMEAIARVELIRGTAALQYGAQYGGYLNYHTKEPANNEPVGVENISTLGSYGLKSTYNAIGGRVGGLTYYGYMSARYSEGYRTGSTSNSQNQYLAATFQLSPEVSLRAQVGRAFYKYRLPGPLTDQMFEADPRQRTRIRDWYAPDITVPALVVDWRRANGVHLTSHVSAVVGDRSSVLKSGFANQPDVPGQNGEYTSRVVQVDYYRSFSSETRLIVPWEMRELDQSLAIGAKIGRNRTSRDALGPGTTGTGWDLSLVGNAGYAVAVEYKSLATAFYAENLFRLSPRWVVVPGVRVETGQTDLEGQIAYYDPEEVPREISHTYPLFGVRSTYEWPGGTEVYGGWAQSYRPQLLQNVVPGNPDERTDLDIEDSRGWTLEAGIRGNLAGRFGYDVNVFELRVNDRFGRVLETEPDGTTYLLRTNEGDSRTRGAEFSIDAWIVQAAAFSLLAHTATAYMDGVYLNGTVLSQNQNVDITGNQIQSVPKWISRSGLTAYTGRLSVNLLVSYTADSFADALNTVEPPANGAVGLVPSYTVVDLNAALQVTDWWSLRAGVNNLADEKYFTKRPEFYPGPGIWPSDGRSMQVTSQFRWGALN